MAIPSENSTRNNTSRSLSGFVAFAAAAGLLFTIYRDGIRDMVGYWSTPEYQHGYLIPVVALYLLWAKAAELHRTTTRSSWIGVVAIIVALLANTLGELSAVYTIIQYALLLAIWGLVACAVGVRGFRILWAGVFFLAFAIPLPKIFEFNLSNLFQLWSSQIGTAFLRMVGISVFLEGNVIDLGTYKLQVVEACSGLRYLFPLMSFAFFCSYIFRGRIWQKGVIFLSSIPITILMNSFRIAVTGVLVNEYGTEQAEGFLHYFEGWIIFVACIGILFLEMAAFAMSDGRRLSQVFEVEIPELSEFIYLVGGSVSRQVIAAIVLLSLGAVASSWVKAREEIIPQHVRLNSFPLVIGDWSGRDGVLDREVLDVLKLSDYMITTYVTPTDPRPIELYVAYYDSQRKGASVHSPRACLPSGGWQIEQFDQHSIPAARADGSPLVVNRALIAQGSSKALVYYWFMQRGRYLTNEFAVKWYIFWDSLTKNRTDGAMVRVMMPIDESTDVAAAEKHAEDFIRTAEPRLYYQIPQESVVPQQPPMLPGLQR